MFSKKQKKQPKAQKTELEKKKPLLYTNFGVSKEREYFVENLSLLVGSGMGILAALDAIEKEMKTKKMKYILAVVKDDIEEGSTIWKALNKSELFSDQTISLVRIGEETGKLVENLQVIATQDEKEKTFRSRIKSAMMYPVFVLSVTVIVGVGIAWFILPKLAQVFSDLKMDLPLVTKILINVGMYLEENGSWVMPLFLFIVTSFFYFLFFFSKTKHIGQAFLFRLPGINKLIMQVELARFGYVLGSLLEAGLPVVSALESLHRSTVFPAYKKMYGHLKAQIEEGNSFQKCFILASDSSRYVPVPIQQLIVAGEKSGKLSETLLKIGRRYEIKTEITTKNLSTVLEPILLVVVWVGVVAVAMAVILPIYSLIGGLETETSSPPPPPPPPAAASEIMQPAETELEVSVEVAAELLEILPTGVGFLNVRSGAAVSYDRVAQVEPGDVYQYIAIQDNWYQIVIDQGGETGWVLGDYVKIIEQNEN